MKNRNVLVTLFIILLLLIIIDLQYKQYINETRIIKTELLYEQTSEDVIDNFKTYFITSRKEYSMIASIEGVCLDFPEIDQFDFNQSILVITLRHSIERFGYTLRSKNDSASKKCIIVPVYNSNETNTIYYYKVPSKYTSATNSKAYILEGEYFYEK